MKRGLLITFEGIEGCGKSTQCKLAAEWFTSKRIAVHCTREPGGTELGIEIRRILLSAKNTSLVPSAEALLYLADRFQHIEEILKPHLDQGQIVLCDRYHDSTVAYQGYARGISLEWIDAIWKASGKALLPDLTLLFDIEPRLGLSRSNRKLQEQNIDEARFENEAIEFHARVRAGFLDLAKNDPKRFVVLDGTPPIEEVNKKVIEILQKTISK